VLPKIDFVKHTVSVYFDCNIYLIDEFYADSVSVRIMPAEARRQPEERLVRLLLLLKESAVFLIIALIVASLLWIVYWLPPSVKEPWKMTVTSARAQKQSACIKSTVEASKLARLSTPSNSHSRALATSS